MQQIDWEFNSSRNIEDLVKARELLISLKEVRLKY